MQSELDSIYKNGTWDLVPSQRVEKHYHANGCISISIQ